MEKLCSRVRPEDAEALEALVKPVRSRASAAAQDFLLLHSNPVPQTTSAAPSATSPSSWHTDEDVGEELMSDRQIQLHLPEIPADQNAAESWGNLEAVCILQRFGKIIPTCDLEIISQCVLLKINYLVYFVHFLNIEIHRLCF